MKMQFANKEFEVELLNGEYRRYVNENGVQDAEYLCVGLYGENKILFHYIDTTGTIVDYIQNVMDNIPEYALEYLTNILNKHTNVLVRLTFIPVFPTSFEIYYDSHCESNDVNDIIQWMGENNDFAATEFRYTEVINGHQKCVGE